MPKRKRTLLSYRSEAIFNVWLRERIYAREGVRFVDFLARCDRGEVPGLTEYDFGAGSDTVTDSTTG